MADETQKQGIDLHHMQVSGKHAEHFMEYIENRLNRSTDRATSAVQQRRMLRQTLFIATIAAGTVALPVAGLDALSMTFTFSYVGMVLSSILGIIAFDGECKHDIAESKRGQKDLEGMWHKLIVDDVNQNGHDDILFTEPQQPISWVHQAAGAFWRLCSGVSLALFVISALVASSTLVAPRLTGILGSFVHEQEVPASPGGATRGPKAGVTQTSSVSSAAAASVSSRRSRPPKPGA